MERLDQLKSKYQSVLGMMSQPGLRLQNVHMENNKLLIRAAAGSQEIKNKVWDAIKRVDPVYADLTADISVDPSLAPAAAPPPPKAAAETYTVKSGDTLSKISKQFYGNANEYMKVFEANRDQLSDPDKIKVGQVLKIPKG